MHLPVICFNYIPSSCKKLNILYYDIKYLYYQLCTDSQLPGHFSFGKKFESANTILSFFWWMVGFYWVVSGGDYLLQSAPRLYWYVFVALISENLLSFSVLCNVEFCTYKCQACIFYNSVMLLKDSDGYQIVYHNPRHSWILEAFWKHLFFSLNCFCLLLTAVTRVLSF